MNTLRRALLVQYIISLRYKSDDNFDLRVPGFFQHRACHWQPTLAYSEGARLRVSIVSMDFLIVNSSGIFGGD